MENKNGRCDESIGIKMDWSDVVKMDGADGADGAGEANWSANFFSDHVPYSNVQKCFEIELVWGFDWHLFA